MKKLESLVTVHTRGTLLNKLKESKLLKSIFLYTMAFFLVIGYIVYIFVRHNKGFIFEEDALKQHIVTLTYFRRLLVGFFTTGTISTFTWNIGNGLNLFGNLTYYIFGDFFSYIAIFFPESKIEFVYQLLIFVRWYFVGIAFLIYCKYKNLKPFGSTIGALMYTFCSFALFSGARHPYFLNAMIIFPLVMIGIEKIILENKTKFYTIIIALLFIVSFYFGYMIALSIAIYGIILTICTYKKDGIKVIIKKLFQVLLYSLIGVMISCVILFPTLIEYISSERTGGTIYPYSIRYYVLLFSNLTSVSGLNWTYIGVQSIILITLPIFIMRRKENYPIFWLLILLALPLLIAQIGSVFSGFSFPNNRWAFIITFLFAYITAFFINNEKKLDKKDIIFTVITLIGYTAYILLLEKVSSRYNLKLPIKICKIQTCIAIFIFFIIIVLDKTKNKSAKTAKGKLITIVHFIFNLGLLGTFIIGILFCVRYLYGTVSGSREYVEVFVDEDGYEKQIDTSIETINGFSDAIDYIKENDSGFFNIVKYPYAYQNLSLISDYNSMGFFYSIIPSRISRVEFGFTKYQISYKSWL